MNGESVVADVLLGTNGVKVHRQGMQHKYSTATLEEEEEDDRLLTLPAADSARHSRERSPSRHHHHHHRSKHRSFSTPRTSNPHEGGGTWSLGRNSAPAAKPKKPKRYLGSASTSLTSIPNAIKLSMLNSGLLSVGEIIFFHVVE